MVSKPRPVWAGAQAPRGVRCLEGKLLPVKQWVVHKPETQPLKIDTATLTRTVDVAQDAEEVIQEEEAEMARGGGAALPRARA